MSRSLSSINTLKLSNLSINNNQTQVDEQVIVTGTAETDVDKLEYQRPAYVAVGLIIAMTAISVLFPLIVTSGAFGGRSIYDVPSKPCLDPCSLTLVESLPENLTYAAGMPTHASTYDTWRRLIALANHSIEIASFYWTLRGADIDHSDPSDWQGEQIFNDLMEAGTTRKIKIKIAQNLPSSVSQDQDTADLVAAGAASVRTVNFTRLLGAGILHTKLWIVDRKHVYIGSANMDWRALTQVKELGAAVYNCSCVAADMAKVFEAYWYLGLGNNTVPVRWPHKYKTLYNKRRPMPVKFNRTQAFTYISSSPSPFCPYGRTVDIDAIIDVINKAHRFIHVAVMDYFPISLYTDKTVFWPRIDDALRRAAIERRVEVRLLASWWSHSRPEMLKFLRSLADLDGVRNASLKVKLFHVPASPTQAAIPFARVNHNKYMVTDTAAYIGTSNWTPDYFNSTGGMGLIINQTEATSNPSSSSPSSSSTVQEQLAAIFERDWRSSYAEHLPPPLPPLAAGGTVPTPRVKPVGKLSENVINDS